MTTKPTLLSPATIEALHGNLPDICIEFFGKVSGMSAALNRSTNPVKAAMTMLARERTQEMLEEHIVRTRMAPLPQLPEAVGELLHKYRKVLRDPEEEDKYYGDTNPEE